jgi:23S rRNA (cytidine2498-2'-O)-methyltransferase
VRARRVALIEAALLTLLKKKQRRLLRTRVVDPAAPFGRDEQLFEVALCSPEAGYASAVSAPQRRAWRHVLSRFPGGKALPPEDKRPPARAHLKLSEALWHLGRAPAAGESCVDLGSAPGSWAWVALQGGAAVTAVDRSPLRGDLMGHPRLTFARGDAFKFAPEAPVDWLVCDVIAFPERSIALLDRWLSEGWCRRFVVTLKFKGEADYPKVDACKAMLLGHGARFGLRQLYNNKNEVTVYGAARS